MVRWRLGESGAALILALLMITILVVFVLENHASHAGGRGGGLAIFRIASGAEGSGQIWRQYSNILAKKTTWLRMRWTI